MLPYWQLYQQLSNCHVQLLEFPPLTAQRLWWAFIATITNKL
jgi:hypothetical protein